MKGRDGGDHGYQAPTVTAFVKIVRSADDLRLFSHFELDIQKKLKAGVNDASSDFKVVMKDLNRSRSAGVDSFR